MPGFEEPPKDLEILSRSRRKAYSEKQICRRNVNHNTAYKSPSTILGMLVSI